MNSIIQRQFSVRKVCNNLLRYVTCSFVGERDHANFPGGRNRPTMWGGPNDSVYLFGGATKIGLLDDIWKYDKDQSIWTWVHGSNVPTTTVWGDKGKN